MNQQEILQALQERRMTPAQARQRLAELTSSGTSGTQRALDPTDEGAESVSLHDRIAIVGMSGRYPGAGNLSEYWALLSEGRSAVKEIPPSRWNVEQYYDPRP